MRIIAPRPSRISTAIWSCALCGLLMIAGAGCATSQEQMAQEAVADYYVGDYANARQLLEPLAKNTDENFVLNNARLGSTALAQNDQPAAEAAFLRAYEVINSLGVNNGGRSLGAALVDEKIKIWKGEPFERAMANFYLGLVYYMEADYNNARAAFENALFKLQDYSDDGKDSQASRQVDSNFILARYMLGRCYQRLGDADLAAANFKKVGDARPELSGLVNAEMNEKSNVLLVVDYGYGPTKVKNGDGALVGFAPKPWQLGPVPQPMVMVDGGVTDVMASPLVDLIALAQDRRWQSIDTIRAIKSVLGTGLIAGGAYEALAGRRREDAAIGLGLIAAGIILKATSQADVRIWEMLPRSTFVIPLALSPGKHNFTVQFPIGGGKTITDVDVPAGGEITQYIRVQ